MRIITDFDGVLTSQDAEASAVGARLDDRLAEALGGDAARAKGILDGVRAAVRAFPERHGWYVGDALGCYADEDPFVFNNATCHALLREGPAEAREALAAAGFEDWEKLAWTCFDEGTTRWRAENPTHVLEGALGALSELFARGAEVVVVSNSVTERIRSILAPTGLLRWGAGKIRLRGGARKFHVTGDRPTSVPASDDFGGRKVLLRRGSYWDILNDERPDVVIGDVLSLDIALPAMLRERVPDFEDTTVCLARHAHTPAWALAACERRGVKIVDGFASLPNFVGG